MSSKWNIFKVTQILDCLQIHSPLLPLFLKKCLFAINLKGWCPETIGICAGLYASGVLPLQKSRGLLQVPHLSQKSYECWMPRDYNRRYPTLNYYQDKLLYLSATEWRLLLSHSAAYFQSETSFTIVETNRKVSTAANVV